MGNFGGDEETLLPVHEYNQLQSFLNHLLKSFFFLKAKIHFRRAHTFSWRLHSQDFSAEEGQNNVFISIRDLLEASVTPENSSEAFFFFFHCEALGFWC